MHQPTPASAPHQQPTPASATHHPAPASAPHQQPTPASATHHPAVLVVAAAIVDDLDAPRRLLAARRHRPLALAGRWEFPGGKVDAGETPLEALHREIGEELGVTIDVGREVVGPDDGAWRISPRYVLRLWAATVRVGEPAPLVEHDELRWLDAGQWLSVPWLDADVRIVELLADRDATPGLR